MAPQCVHVGGRHAAHQAIPGHQLNEAPMPVDAYEAHILLHTRQIQNPTPCTCGSHNMQESATPHSSA